MHGAYLDGLLAQTLPVSWHYTVDDREIWQHLPVSENGWHAGDGTYGTGNRASIGVELCEAGDMDPDLVADLGARLCAHLWYTQPTVQGLRRHEDWSGKRCPALLMRSGWTWERFSALVHRYLDAQRRPAVEVRLPTGRIITGELREQQVWVEVAGIQMPVRAVAELLGARVHWDPGPPASVTVAVG